MNDSYVRINRTPVFLGASRPLLVLLYYCNGLFRPYYTGFKASFGFSYAGFKASFGLTKLL